MAITPPVPIDAGPALPSSSDSEATFDAAFEAFLSWQKTQLQPQTNAIAANVYSNAVEAEASATTATTKAGEASASAQAAATARAGSEDARDDAQTYAALAGVAAGLPALAGQGGKTLRARTNETGVEWYEPEPELPSLAGKATLGLRVNADASGVEWASIDGNTGDIIMAVNPELYAAPDYLPADGSLFLRSSYPALSGLIPSAEWSTGTKLPNPGTLPPSTGSGVAFSPSGTYLAVAHGSSPYITIYKRSGDTFDKLSNPAALPAANAMACAWSDDETYLSVVTTADVRVYKRSGDVFTKLADPAASGVSNTAVTFSPGGDYLAVTGFGSPYLAIYKRSGDTFAKITNPATMPTGAAYGCVFSADGVYLAVSHNTSPFITIYKRSGDVFTKLTNPGVLPSSASSVAFSSNAQYLLVGGSGATPLALYKRSGDIFTRLADPRGATSVITAASVTFSKDNAWAAAVSASSGGSYLGLFARSGDVMTKITDLATSPTATCNSCDFSPDGLFLAVAHSGTPYVSIYKADPDIFATPRTTELVGPCYIKS